MVKVTSLQRRNVFSLRDDAGWRLVGPRVTSRHGTCPHIRGGLQISKGIQRTADLDRQGAHNDYSNTGSKDTLHLLLWPVWTLHPPQPVLDKIIELPLKATMNGFALFKVK